MGKKYNFHIRGTTSDDYLVGNNHDNTITGGNGRDELFGFDGNDILTGGKGDDYLSGGRGDDILTGGKGDDVMRGKSGNDVLILKHGYDIAEGGSGFDTFIFHKNLEGANIDGGSKQDTIIFVGQDRSDFDIVAADFDGGLYLKELGSQTTTMITRVETFVFADGSFKMDELL